jgi:CO/xanthine dehydrogenase Mo-binding subunit
MGEVGKPVPRREGPEKVTGRRVYVDDWAPEGALTGVTVRSSVPRARIKAVHFDPGVPWDEITVVTAADLKAWGLHNVVALILDDQPVLADGVVNHPEEPVVLLAHPDPYVAEAARRKVRIEYEPLPAAVTLDQALAKAPLVWGADNVLKEIAIDKGDVDQAFSGAHLVVEGTYETGAQEQLYIETNGMIGEVDARTGKVTVWGSLQCPYYVHKALKALFVGKAEVRVVQMETGGGFGGKEEYPSIIAAHVALLAKKAKRPVKMIYDRSEDMEATTKRHPSRTRHRTAVDERGRLLAMDVEFLLDGGAYATLSAVVLSRGAIHACGPYDCPNVRVRARALATNSPPNGAFRGFGAPQSVFAVERQMDLVARRLGLSPEDFRKRNLLARGKATATGQVVKEDPDIEGLMARAFKLSDYEAKRAAYARQPADARLRKGIGFATFMHGAGFTGSGEKYLASEAAVDVTPEGRVRVLSASTEIGQGTITIFSQIAADALGLPLAMVEVAQPDTDVVPDSGPTVASRTVMVVGRLVERAAQDLRRLLVDSGALPKSAAAGPLDPEAFKRAAATYRERHGLLRALVKYQPPPDIVWDDKTYKGDAYATFAWACYVAELTVDMDTLQVQVDDFVAVQEVGHVVHPVLAAGQIEGGVAQGVGYALTEEVVMREGRMANGRMANYIVPTAADAPTIRVEFVERPSPHGPGKGAKGIGELPLDGAAPAIAAALDLALGGDARVHAIPATPERLLALRVAQRGGVR